MFIYRIDTKRYNRRSDRQTNNTYTGQGLLLEEPHTLHWRLFTRPLYRTELNRRGITIVFVYRAVRADSSTLGRIC